MTVPTEEPGFLLRMIFDKLDGIDKKVDGQAERLAAHEIRIASLEKDNDSKSNVKAGLYAALVGALASGAVAVPLAFLH